MTEVGGQSVEGIVLLESVTTYHGNWCLKTRKLNVANVMRHPKLRVQASMTPSYLYKCSCILL